MKIELIHGDCLEEMSKIPDGSVDLVLTDPPYGLNKKLKGGSWGVTSTNNHSVLKRDFIVTEEYINELMRVSKNQIIWGGKLLPVTRV